MREVLELDVDLENRLPLSGTTRRGLADLFAELRRRGAGSKRSREAVEGLTRTIRAILMEDEGRLTERG